MWKKTLSYAGNIDNFRAVVKRLIDSHWQPSSGEEVLLNEVKKRTNDTQTHGEWKVFTLQPKQPAKNPPVTLLGYPKVIVGASYSGNQSEDHPNVIGALPRMDDYWSGITGAAMIRLYETQAGHVDLDMEDVEYRPINPETLNKLYDVIRAQLVPVNSGADSEQDRVGAAKKGGECADNGNGPTDKTRLRADCFKRLKDINPSLTQPKLALAAAEELGDTSITENTVRNVYTAMGWKWDKGNRIR